MKRTTPSQWLIFFSLPFAWGSSYMWIKLALQELPAGRLVTLRVLFAAATLVAYFLTTKKKLPRNRRMYAKLLLLGLLSIVIPFHLLTWGASQISSVLTGILNGTVPLCTVVLAHFCLPGERMHLFKFLGLCLGMAGSVVLVASGNADGLAGLTHMGATSSMLGALAVLASSVCYGSASVLARRMIHGIDPTTMAMVVTCISAVILVLIEVTVNRHTGPVFPSLPLTWLALAWMGIVGSGLAYALYYHLVSVWDASRASFVMYLAPLVGMVLGLTFLGERPGVLLYIGTILVFSGIGVTNLRQRP